MVRDAVNARAVKLVKVASLDNKADALTKVIPPTQAHQYANLMGNREPR